MALTFHATADVRFVIVRSTQLLPKAAEMVRRIWKLVHLKFNIFWWQLQVCEKQDEVGTNLIQIKKILETKKRQKRQKGGGS